MKTIAVVSQKGGAGKTTLAIHLASSSSIEGKNSAIIDLDPQASSANWSDRRESEVPVVISAHASRLKHEISRANEAGCDVLYLDTAPHSDSTALAAIKASDLVLIPCRPAILDMEAIANSISLVRTSNAPFYIVMNATAAQGTDAKEAAEAIQQIIDDIDPQIGNRICPHFITNRIAFSRAPITGETAQEYQPRSKAALEIEHVHKFVCEHVGIQLSKETQRESEYGKQVCESI